MTLTAGDRLALDAIETALRHAREDRDRRPALELLASSLVELGVRATPQGHPPTLLARDRGAWLRRLAAAQRSESTITAYRIAIDDLLAWAEHRCELMDEHAIVDYLAGYEQRCDPEPATYYRRFVLLRRCLGWSCRRHGSPDPFLELPAPAKPRHTSTWLTREESARLLAGAECPRRNRPGLIQRDRLVLLALVITGLRRSELIAVRWVDVTLDPPRPSLLVHRGKGGAPRRQPLPDQLVGELACWHELRQLVAGDHVFCGLAGGPLSPAALTRIISRAARHAALDKHVTAHTLRHTAATWLRQEGADARLVAEYLGHADLTTVSRYANVTDDEMHTAVQRLSDTATPSSCMAGTGGAAARDG
jgi:site-specific recombinase XerD